MALVDLKVRLAYQESLKIAVTGQLLGEHHAYGVFRARTYADCEYSANLRIVRIGRETWQLRQNMVYDLVCPRMHALSLARQGKLSAELAAAVSWKDPIATLLTDRQMAEAGVTIEEVQGAIASMTATRATVTRERIGTEGEPGYLVMAKGYRAGPAGDH